MNMLRDDLDPRTAFERSRAVLSGAIQEIDLPEVRKMITIILAPQQADVSISPKDFDVDFGFQNGPLRYWPKLAAPALHAICRGHLGTTSARFRLRADEIDRIRIGPNRLDRWIWLFEEPQRILLFSREANQDVQPENPVQLSRWVAAKRVWAVFDDPKPCPHCATRGVRFRAIERALICPSCGRSWAIERKVLEEAFLEAGG